LQASDSLFPEKTFKGKAKRSKPGMTLAQLQELELKREADTRRGFESLKSLAVEMEKGSPEAEAAWLLEAENLVESFRQVKPLFPSTRVSPECFERPLPISTLIDRVPRYAGMETYF
jgi:hypothetical protein